MKALNEDEWMLSKVVAEVFWYTALKFTDCFYGNFKRFGVLEGFVPCYESYG